MQVAKAEHDTTNVRNLISIPSIEIESLFLPLRERGKITNDTYWHHKKYLLTFVPALACLIVCIGSVTTFVPRGQLPREDLQRAPYPHCYWPRPLNDQANNTSTVYLITCLLRASQLLQLLNTETYVKQQF